MEGRTKQCHTLSTRPQNNITFSFHCKLRYRVGNLLDKKWPLWQKIFFHLLAPKLCIGNFSYWAKFRTSSFNSRKVTKILQRNKIQSKKSSFNPPTQNRLFLFRLFAYKELWPRPKVLSETLTDRAHIFRGTAAMSVWEIYFLFSRSWLRTVD